MTNRRQNNSNNDMKKILNSFNNNRGRNVTPHSFLTNKRLLNKILNMKFGVPILILLVIGVFAYSFLVDDDSTSNDFNSELISEDTIVPGEKYAVTVSRFVDGDTTEFYFMGDTSRFRYITIDAPELDHETGNHEPFALEAKERVEELLTEADVIYVEFDVGRTQDDYDRYLAYVYADDIMLNTLLIEEGLAEAKYVNPPNTKYLDDMEEAEDSARSQQLGIWSR